MITADTIECREDTVFSNEFSEQEIQLDTEGAAELGVAPGAANYKEAIFEESSHCVQPNSQRSIQMKRGHFFLPSILLLLGANAALALPDYSVEVVFCDPGDTTRLQVSVRNVGNSPATETTNLEHGVINTSTKNSGNLAVPVLVPNEVYLTPLIETQLNGDCFGLADPLSNENQTDNNYDREGNYNILEDGIVITVPAANLFNTEITLDLSTGPIPPDWTVTIPEMVTIPANSQTNFAVEITTMMMLDSVVVEGTTTSLGTVFGTWSWNFTNDQDLDGVINYVDNCIALNNSDQADSNGDDIGNACDADVTGPGGTEDCLVNFLDLNSMKTVFFSTDPDHDLTGPAGAPDGIVNFLDLNRMKEMFFGPPGPSAAGCN